MLMKDDQNSASGSQQIVTMMQPAEPGHRYNLAASYGIQPCFATGRRSLRQREMRSIFMVVADVLIHQSPQMTLVQHDDMIEQVPTAAADPALCNTILPRAPEAGSFRLDAQCLDGTDDLLIEVRGSIEDQIPWGRIVGECFAQLLRDPDATRMAGDAPNAELAAGHAR